MPPHLVILFSMNEGLALVVEYAEDKQMTLVSSLGAFLD